MATKELSITQADVASFTDYFGVIPEDDAFKGIVAVYKYGTAFDAGDEEGARKIAKENEYEIHELWRKCKENEAAVKKLKPFIEKICESVEMPDWFKWQAGARRTTKTVDNTAEMVHRLEEAGIKLDAILSRCTIDFDECVELAGLSEQKFLEEFAGDICTVEVKQNKSTLKAL